MQRTRKKGGRKPQPSFGERLIQAMDEAIAIERGELKPAAVRRYPVTARQVDAEPAPDLGAADVRRIREELDVSQPVFAAALNVSSETVKSWEQDKSRPSGAATRLLQIAQLMPDVIRATILSRKHTEVSTGAYTFRTAQRSPRHATLAARVSHNRATSGVPRAAGKSAARKSR